MVFLESNLCLCDSQITMTTESQFFSVLWLSPRQQLSTHSQLHHSFLVGRESESKTEKIHGLRQRWFDR